MRITGNFNNCERLFKNILHCSLACMMGFILVSCNEEDHKQQLPDVVEQELDRVRQSVIVYRDLKKAITAGHDHEVTGYHRV